jgi:two-component system, chemotaxis family, chemotaxis protein CheY
MSRFDFSDLRVLVVDDNVHMCRLVRTMLSAFGMRHVTEAGDGAEALERLEQGQFEILVVDWEMPVLDGADLVRLVRNPEHLYCYAPIIMITGHSTYRRTQEALALGVNDVLSKPFSPHALYARIADNVLKPRPFIRSQDYFGPRPRLNPEDSDPLHLGVSPEDVGSTERAADGAIDLDALSVVA